MNAKDNLSSGSNDRSPRPPRRKVGRAAPPSRTAPTVPSLSSGPDDQEWHIRRHNSALSLRQLVRAATPKRGNDQIQGSDPAALQPCHKSRSMVDIGVKAGRSLSPMSDLSKRKVIRSPNSNHSWESKRTSNQGRSCGMAQKPHANFVWPHQRKQADAGVKKCTQDRGIPDSIQIVSSCEVSTSLKQVTPLLSDGRAHHSLSYGASDDDSSTSSETSSLVGSGDDFVVPLWPSATKTFLWQESSGSCSGMTSSEEILQKNLNEALASLSGSTRSPSLNPSSGYRTRRIPGTLRSFDTDRSKQRLDDSKRTASTMVTTGSASEYSPAQSSAQQAPKTSWICLCGEDNDHDYMFCGMCARPEKWACTECHFERNKCRQIYCGKCGSRRALASTMPVQNQASVPIQNHAA